MANKSLFTSLRGRLLPSTNAVNAHGAGTYEYGAQHKLAQLAMTGTMNQTFYAQAQDQVKEILVQASAVDAEFLAKTAIYARANGHMKDVPALLLAVLSTLDVDLFAKTFPRVIDNGKMVRNFVQIMRSGVVGRKSLGSRPKTMIAGWLKEASTRAFLQGTVGQDPSLADVIKMVHPKPMNAQQDALFAWAIGKPCDINLLPEEVQGFIRFKADNSSAVPDVPFQLLTSLSLSKEHWTEIALKGGWHMVRMNLNTFARHGVLEDPEVVGLLVEKLMDPDVIKRARVFPYQLMAAYAMTGEKVPTVLRDALQDAMELATQNVPVFDGNIVVCPDVSGSMTMPITGYRQGASSRVRCIDVAGLIASTVLRQNKQAKVLPFECGVVDVSLNARDSVMTNAQRLSEIGGGGTNCSAPLAKLNQDKAKVKLVLMISDNQSWVDGNRYGATAVMKQWNKLKRRNPRARLVCLDIAPYGASQATEREDILNIGGFSDQVFGVINAFAKGELNADHFVGEIEKVTL